MIARIEIKLATISDLPAMQKAGDALFDYDVKPDRAREFMNDPRHHLVLAYDEDNIVGMASGFHYVHPDKDPTLFINEVSVIKEYQNKGIGRKMVNFLCEYAKQLDCLEAWLGTEISNIAARKSYKAASGIEDEEHAVIFTFDLRQ